VKLLNKDQDRERYAIAQDWSRWTVRGEKAANNKGSLKKETTGRGSVKFWAAKL